MGGKTNEHYYYDDFVENFPGHTTDFSIAQTNGFLQALREYVQQRFSVQKTDYELRTDLDIRYCTVHFFVSSGKKLRVYPKLFLWSVC